MKYCQLFVGSLFIVVLFVTPDTSLALSCVSPVDAVEDYLASDSYRIVVASPVEFREFSTHDAQLLDVSQSIKRSAREQEWIYYHKDDTWGYACSGQPPAIGKEMIYVIYDPANYLADLHTVVQTFEIDSEAGGLLLEASTDTDHVLPLSASNQEILLSAEIRKLMTTIRMKLAEWRWWRSV